MFFILSKDQHNQLAAIATAKGLRNMNEALDFALGEISNPLMEEFHAKKLKILADGTATPTSTSDEKNHDETMGPQGFD